MSFSFRSVLILAVSLTIFISASAQAGFKASDCRAPAPDSLSSYPPNVTVDGTVLRGSDALDAVRSLSRKSGATVVQKTDLFGDLIRVYSRTLKTDKRTDPHYPNEGCTRKAALKEVCELDAASKKAKCAQICQFDYNCIDNR